MRKAAAIGAAVLMVFVIATMAVSEPTWVPAALKKFVEPLSYVMKERGNSGTVHVVVHVTTNGHVDRVLANDAATDIKSWYDRAARGATFEPARLNGEPVESENTITYHYVFTSEVTATSKPVPR